ncbi:hypothetical protein Syun_010207 [Stephania yunnanensis]|uniref:Uncharacterized protein n=1 Tax=Stephania yunnanensis TaxID=152371 RepID=A0AAP0PPF0_9MAGN
MAVEAELSGGSDDDAPARNGGSTAAMAQTNGIADGGTGSAAWRAARGRPAADGGSRQALLHGRPAPER